MLTYITSLSAQLEVVDTTKIYKLWEVNKAGGKRAIMLNDFSDYCSNNLNISKQDIENGIAEMYVQCWQSIDLTVEKDGKITFDGCRHCQSEMFENCIKEVITSPLCPKWQPATIQNIPVCQKSWFGFSCIKFQ